MRKTSISAALGSALALLSGPLSAQQRAPATGTHVVACSGTFAKDSSEDELETAFDSKNVIFADVETNDGTKVPASVLFPNDPKRRLEVWWSNPANHSDIHLIVIGGQSTWTAPGGMRLGQTLEQVEKLNQKPFKLKGYDKNRIATVIGWDGGALLFLAAARRALASALIRKLQLKRPARFQPTRNICPRIRQSARQSQQSARF